MKYQIVARKVGVRRKDRWLVRIVSGNGEILNSSELLNSADAAETNLLAVARGHSPRGDAHLSVERGEVAIAYEFESPSGHTRTEVTHRIPVEWIDERDQR